MTRGPPARSCLRRCSVTRLEWGDEARLFEMGVDQGVLYLATGAVPWNGLVSVKEEISADVDTSYYFDGQRAHVLVQSEDYAGSIQAYTYPDIFAEYNGFGPRETYKRFDFSYRVEHGDAYQIHLVYGALVNNNARSWNSTSDKVDPSLFVWDISAKVQPVLGSRPTAHMVIDSEELSWVRETIEDVLYGTDTSDPRMPTPVELVDIYESATSLRITRNGDGTYTASGSDDMLRVNPDGSFDILAPSAYPSKTGKFTVRSSA